MSNLEYHEGCSHASNSEEFTCFGGLKNQHQKLEESLKNQINTSDEQVSVEKFLLQCLGNLDNVNNVLFLDIFNYITKNKENLAEQTDWEILFNLLYTHYFKFKVTGGVIYRDG